MIKSRRKVNKALIVNNIRLCRDAEGTPVYLNLVTGKGYGFADRRRLKLKRVSIGTLKRIRSGLFGEGYYPELTTISG